MFLSRPQSQALQLRINSGSKFEQLETKPLLTYKESQLPFPDVVTLITLVRTGVAV